MNKILSFVFLSLGSDIFSMSEKVNNFESLRRNKLEQFEKIIEESDRAFQKYKNKKCNSLKEVLAEVYALRDLVVNKDKNGKITEISKHFGPCNLFICFNGVEYKINISDDLFYEINTESINNAHSKGLYVNALTMLDNIVKTLELKITNMKCDN